MNFSFANAPHGLSAVPVSGAFLAEIFVKPVIGTDNSAEVQSRDEDSTRLHLTAGIKRRDYCARKQRHAHVCSEASNDPPSVPNSKRVAQGQPNSLRICELGAAGTKSWDGRARGMMGLTKGFQVWPAMCRNQHKLLLECPGCHKIGMPIE